MIVGSGPNADGGGSILGADVHKRRVTRLVVRMVVDNEIPLSRGMGSSAAAIIAGITCYELLADDKLSEREIFNYAREFESHPDNLAAALRGGLVAATESADGDVLVAKLSPAVRMVDCVDAMNGPVALVALTCTARRH